MLKYYINRSINHIYTLIINKHFYQIVAMISQDHYTKQKIIITLAVVMSVHLGSSPKKQYFDYQHALSQLLELLQAWLSFVDVLV